MRWRSKALLQTVFSRIPYGERLNYVAQRHVLRSLPLDDKALAEKVEEAKRHLAALERHGSVPIGSARFYEFGAGKDLAIPLALFCLGVEHQVLVDIRRIARLELVADAARRLAEVGTGLERTAPVFPPAARLDVQLASMGIRYLAPSDARATGLPAATVDYVTSTSTLEHIPPGDIRSILQECRRILVPNGLMSMFIDYQDHYSYADPSITAYNFLRFEDARWARWNPSLQYQNRLRHIEYSRLLAEAGFDVVADDARAIGPADLSELSGIPLATRFRDYTPEQLAVRDALLVVKPR